MFEESVSNPSIWASMNSWFTPTVLFVLLNLMIGTILFSSNLPTPPEQQQQQQNQEEKQEDQDSNNQNHQQNPKLVRSPSVIERIKSINFKTIKQTLDSATAHYSSEHFNQEIQSAIEKQTSYIFEETIHQETLMAQTHFIFPQTHEEKSPDSQIHLVSQQAHHDDIQDDEPQSLDEVYSQLGNVTDSHFTRTTSDTKPASGEVPAKLPTKMKKSASMKSPFAHFEENDIVETRRPETMKEKRPEPDAEVDAKADDFINKFKQQLKLQRMDSIMRYKEVINRGSTK